MRRFTLSLALLLMLVVAAGCGKASLAPSFETESGQVKVAASFYPLYEFTRIVGGDRVDVVYMVPTGTEPHDWEPSAGHIKTLNQADLFIYNGAGMEPWVAKTLKSLDNKAIGLLETSQGFDLLEGADDGHGHDDEAEWDPHIWLDPYGVIHTVEAIRDALTKADPTSGSLFAANADAYIAQLKLLDEEFRTQLADCKREEFFTSHAAFGYLAQRYNLEQHALMGLSPEAEPRPRQLRQIVEEAKEHGATYIFFETLASDKVAKMVAQEIGAKTMVLNPFEGLTAEEQQAGKNYLSVMRENLANLKIALECGQ